MSQLNFYRQLRADGGIRTGISIDGITVLGHFQAGSEDHDPALLWYVDVRCEGDVLPTDPAEARQYLMRIADDVRRAMLTAADEIPAGFDRDLEPFQRVFTLPDGTTVTIAASAVRRIDALAMAKVFREIAHGWDGFLRQLEPMAVV